MFNLNLRKIPSQNSFRNEFMTELSPFSVLLITTQWKLVNRKSQEPLELGL